LLDALNAFQDATSNGPLSGRIVIASTGAGRSVTFATPQIWQSMTPEDLYEFSGELIEIYNDAVAALGGTPTDAQIYAAMLASDRLATITSVQKDWSTLKYPTRF